MVTTATTNGVSLDEASEGALEDALRRARGVRETCEREQEIIRTSLSAADSAAATAEREHMADASAEKLEAALAAHAKADEQRAALAASERRLQQAIRGERAAAGRLDDARLRARKAALRKACSVDAYHAETADAFRRLAPALNEVRAFAQHIDGRWRAAYAAARELRALGEPAQPLDSLQLVAGFLRDMGETGDVAGLVGALERTLSLLGPSDGNSSLEFLLLGSLDGILHTDGAVKSKSDAEHQARVEDLEALLSQPTRHLGIKALQDLRFRRAGTPACVETDLAEVNRRRTLGISPPEGFVNPGTPPYHVAGQPTPYQAAREAAAKARAPGAR